MELLLAPMGIALLATVAALAYRAGRRATAQPQPAPADRIARETAADLGAAIARTTAIRDDLYALLVATDAGVLRLDGQFRVQSANPAAHQLFRRPDGGMVSRPLLEAIVDVPVEEHLRASAASGGSGPWREFDIGAGSVVSVALRPAVDGGWWAIARDASELTRLRRIRTEFVENLSHELRTPVTAIGLLAELLVAETAPDGSVPTKVRERILQLESDAVHLGQMINELLDLARVESGEGMRLNDEVDLVAVARSAIDRLRPYADQARVSVTLSGDTTLRLGRSGNAARLEQAVANLVHNALKFSVPGGSVEVRVAGDGHEATASVRDHGVGIARADLDRVFERFFVADRARSKGGGTGLGLAIARHIAEAHGGRITVASQLGEGSTFTLALPLR